MISHWRVSVRLSVVLLGLSLACSVTAGQQLAEANGKPVRSNADLPVNEWVKLPLKTKGPYMFCQPCYAPGHGILHWGYAKTAYRCSSHPHNDVIAFDPAKLDWISQYKSASAKEFQNAERKLKIGIKLRGKGGMLPSGTPAPSVIGNGVCWDSKRKRLIYAMNGFMAAYDPATKKWAQMNAEGLPGCHGMGIAYDALNDEILMFPHFGGTNRRRQGVNDNVYGHHGTHRYSFRDEKWAWVGDTFGSPETRAARNQIEVLIGKLSKANDSACRHRAGRKNVQTDDVVKALNVIAADLSKVAASESARKLLDQASAKAKSAAESAAAGKWNDAVHASGRALWTLDEEILNGVLRVEPPARCGTPLLFVPKHNVIVMFGGHNGLVRLDLATPRGKGGRPGSLNDTWIYDCKTRQWREVSKANRPPPTLWVRAVYDPASDKVLLVTRQGGNSRKKIPSTISIWSFDIQKEEWSLADRQEWKHAISTISVTGWGNYLEEVAYDPASRLLVLLQHREKRPELWQETFVMKLDASRFEAKPAPAWNAPPPIKPQEVPPDDPKVLEKLKNLPANKWIHMRPSNDGPTRDWGNAAVDPVTGYVYYHGGGHSTYQVNDVAIYNPGANKWAYAVGEHNDWLPPAGWGGSHRGMRGGGCAHHMRNAYVAVAGRMYRGIGSGSMRWSKAAALKEGPRSAQFYDVDRGGVWRCVTIDKVDRVNGAGTFGRTHLASRDGRVMGFGGGLEPYDGRFFPRNVYFSIHDPFANTLVSKKVPAPVPDWISEVRPFTVAPDKGKEGQILFVAFRSKKAKVFHKGTWIYDIASNSFKDLKAKNQPDGRPFTVEYIDGQDAAMSIINRKQYVYSFSKNAWTALTLQTDGRMSFSGPYAQMVYSAKYGVFVNLGSASRGTAVMRPDLSTLKWE